MVVPALVINRQFSGESLSSSNDHQPHEKVIFVIPLAERIYEGQDGYAVNHFNFLKSKIPLFAFVRVQDIGSLLLLGECPNAIPIFGNTPFVENCDPLQVKNRCFVVRVNGKDFF